MLERHEKDPKGGSSLLSDGDNDDNGDSSSALSAGTSSSKENFEGSAHELKTEDDDEEDDSDHEEADNLNDHHSDRDDADIDISKRMSVLEMAQAIEASMTNSPKKTVRKPVADADDANSVSTPPQAPAFWSLQANPPRRSSIASTLSKIKRQPTAAQHPPEPEPQILLKTPEQEPKETINPDLDIHGVSPVTSPAAILCCLPTIPSPTSSKLSNRTAVTRETLEGSGPRVRLTRSELLRQKANEKQQKQTHKREETTLKPRTNGIVNRQSLVSRQKDYPKPWLASSSDTVKKQTPTNNRTSRTTSRPEEPPPPRIPTGKEPHIDKLPGRRSRSRPGSSRVQTGKVRLTRSTLLKLRQAQEKAATQMTLQDMDNQRLGIPPVKFLEVPNSPTKIDFEDDEMEHPNDIARRKLRELFDDNKA